MSTVRRKVATHNSSAESVATHHIHALLMDLVRAAGLLQLDQTVPGQPISVSQTFALHELDTGVPLSQRDLAARLRLDKSTVSRMAADLERRGLVVRERDPANRRLYRLRLTDEGRAMHRHMADAFNAQYVRWVAMLTPAERDALLCGLPGLVRAMRADPSPWDHRPHAE
jgi:DNA-binding MarR family transcriptional regulator